MDVGVVIPVGPGREANLRRVLDDIDAQTVQPLHIVLVWDGIPSLGFANHRAPIHNLEIPKHEPGREQPRNVGVRALEGREPIVDWVWFLDTDVAVEPTALEAYVRAVDANPEPRIMVGPYDWLPENLKGLRPDGPFAQRDVRWDSFNEYGPEHVLRGAVGHGLACFSGNLVWPIADFTRIGGFHPDLHHGRCEDGELGLRAISQGVGVSMVKDARGYHQWHPVNMEWVLRANERDVPLLNRMHPWAEAGGLVMTAKDGIRFDFRCQCGERINSLEYWHHRSGCAV